MKVNLLFSKKDQIIVITSKSKNKVSGSYILENKDTIDETGLMTSPEETADFLLREFQKKKIKPKTIGITLDRKAVISFQLTVESTSKKLLEQMVKLAVEEKYPGTLSTNVLSFKIYSNQKNTYNVGVMLTSKVIIDSYLRFTKRLRIKLDYIEALPNVLAQTFRNYNHASDKAIKDMNIQTLAVGISKNNMHVLSLSNYEVTMSNTISLPAYISADGDVEAKNSRIVTGLNQVIATIDNDAKLEVYVEYEDDDSLNGVDDLKEKLGALVNAKIHIVNETYDELLSKCYEVLVTRKAEQFQNIDFKTSLEIDNFNSHVGVNKIVYYGCILFAVVGIAIGGTSGYFVVNNYILDDKIDKKNEYISTHSYIDDLIERYDTASDKYDRVEIIDQFLTYAKPDFIAVESELNSIVATKNESTVFNVSVSPSLEVQLDGQAPAYENVAAIMDDITEKDEYNNVFLANISEADGIHGDDTVYFTLTFNYDLSKTFNVETEETTEETNTESPAGEE